MCTKPCVKVKRTAGLFGNVLCTIMSSDDIDLGAQGGTEEGSDAKVDVNELKGKRKAKLGYLTRQKNVIVSMITEDEFSDIWADEEEVSDVCNRLQKFENTLTEFMDLQAKVQNVLPPLEREASQEWFEPKLLACKAFMDDVKDWIQKHPVKHMNHFWCQTKCVIFLPNLI